MSPYVDKDVMKKYQKNWMRNRRQLWVDAHGPCAHCGGSDRLQVDHIDPSKKTMNPAKLWSMSNKNEKKIAELENCQVLCHTCHWTKTLKERRERKKLNDLYGDSSSIST